MDDQAPVNHQTEQAEALARVKQALADCPHPRGQNWTPAQVTVGRGRGRRKVPGFRNPCIALNADDICTLAEMIPEAKRDQVVEDLFNGVDEHCGEDPPNVVHIHVDDAHHLADLAGGLDPAPPRKPTRLPPAPVPTRESKRASEE